MEENREQTREKTTEKIGSKIEEHRVNNREEIEKNIGMRT